MTPWNQIQINRNRVHSHLFLHSFSHSGRSQKGCVSCDSGDRISLWNGSICPSLRPQIKNKPRINVSISMRNKPGEPSKRVRAIEAGVSGGGRLFKTLLKMWNYWRDVGRLYGPVWKPVSTGSLPAVCCDEASFSVSSWEPSMASFCFSLCSGWFWWMFGIYLFHLMLCVSVEHRFWSVVFMRPSSA